MAIVLERQSSITGSFTPVQKEMLYGMVQRFRIIMADDDIKRNVLEKFQLSYTDDKIYELLTMAVDDLNLGIPRTSYDIWGFFIKPGGAMLMVKGAVVFAIMREGMHHTKNQMTYNDNGLSVDFFNKTSLYQSWMQFYINDYLQAKQAMKEAEVASSANGGFYGIASEFGWFQGYGYGTS